MLIKQAASLSRFHVCFHVFLRSFVPFQHVALGISAAVVRRHGGSRVGARGCLMLVLRCYGFYKVLDSPRYFVSAGVKARVQRTGFRVVLARVGER